MLICRSLGFPLYISNTHSKKSAKAYKPGKTPEPSLDSRKAGIPYIILGPEFLPKPL